MESSSIDMVFLHKDQFEEKYGGEFSCPVVLKRDGGLEVLITTQEVNEITTSGELIRLVQTRAT
jgi:hypothetical protein